MNEQRKQANFSATITPELRKEIDDFVAENKITYSQFFNNLWEHWKNGNDVFVIEESIQIETLEIENQSLNKRVKHLIGISNEFIALKEKSKLFYEASRIQAGFAWIFGISLNDWTELVDKQIEKLGKN